MIDNNGYRSNVGIVICNFCGQLLWARRRKQQNAWQFPQGGIRIGETPEEAMYRELFEEVGLKKTDVVFLYSIPYWLHYKLPNYLIRSGTYPSCIGQKQKWFLLQILCEKNINIKQGKYDEFDDWRWVSFWYPLRNIVFFKRTVYRKMMKEFSRVVMKLCTVIVVLNKV